jgi:hypothetical protein
MYKRHIARSQAVSLVDAMLGNESGLATPPVDRVAAMTLGALMSMRVVDQG